MITTWSSTKKLTLPDYALFHTILLLFETSLSTFDTYRSNRVYITKTNIL